METHEQFAFLKLNLCDEGQGYYFGHPLVAEVFAESLRTGLRPQPAMMQADLQI